MVQVYKRGKVYYYTLNIDGEQIRRSTGLTSKKAAQELADEQSARWKTAHARGFDAELTLNQAIQNYIDDKGDDYISFLSVINAAWGKKKLRTIQPAWVRENAPSLYPDRIGKHGRAIKAAGPATLNRQVITPLQAVINHAYQAEDGRKVRIEKFEVDSKKKAAVDWDWHDKFKEHALSAGQAAMARFMFETGARISEAVRVKAEHVDLDGRTILLPKTKTKPRLTRISQELAAMITPLLTAAPRHHRNNKGAENGIFGYASRHSVYNGWKTVCAAAGISYSPPHSSGRVSYATETVVRNGVDPVTAAKNGGWASPKLLLDTYAKAEESSEMVDDIFGKRSKNKAQIQHSEKSSHEDDANSLNLFDKSA